MFRAERMAEARDLYARADRLLSESEDTRLRSAVVNNLGVVCREIGEFDSALDHLRRALAMPGHSLRDGLITEIAVGVTLNSRGEHQAALDTFERVLGLPSADRFGYGRSCGVDGHVGRPSAAGEHHRSGGPRSPGLKAALKSGFPEPECEALTPKRPGSSGNGLSTPTRPA
ncbi:tetratricopeptide repeat protein [Lentzea xinjiangensis]|uniref:tetratricopeptide repeat protein n=1 Tax=Lentzea xinjiangensis TaxID=402600 RepID=UPI000B7DCBD5|nr:tetratricopeptide repeat protein [Lentzea xinjiangensis]